MNTLTYKAVAAVLLLLLSAASADAAPAATAQISIARPHRGVPEFAVTGGLIRVEIRAKPGLDPRQWTALLANDLRSWPAKVEKAEHGTYLDNNTAAGYRLGVRLPPDISPELFKLTVSHPRGGAAANPHCVSVLRAFETNFYILHLADVQAWRKHATSPTGAGFKTADKKEYGSLDVLAWAAPSVNLIHPRFLLHTGDELENGGDTNEEGTPSADRYRQYADALDAFSVPSLLTRGNNDRGDYAVWKSVFGVPTYSLTLGSFYVCMNDYNAAEYLPWLQKDYTASLTDTTITYHLVGQHSNNGGKAWNPPAASLMLVGHGHGFAILARQPYPTLMCGPAFIHGDAGFFEFVKNGSEWTCLPDPSTHGGDKRVSLFRDGGAPNVANTFAVANNGTTVSNTATVVNHIARAFPDGRVRFLVKASPQGYTVTGGEKLSEYTYNSGASMAVLAKVNLAANTTTTVSVTRTDPRRR